MSSAKKRYVPPRFMSFFLVAISIFILSFSATAETETPKVTFEWLVEPELHRANSFRHGVAWFQREEGGPWTLIDKNGKTIIKNFEVNFIGNYGDDVPLAPFAGLRDRPGYGYVDCSGKIVIAPRFAEANVFVKGMALIVETSGDKKYRKIIDHYGNMVLFVNYDDIRIAGTDLFAAKKDGKWGYVDKKAGIVVDFILDEPYPLIFPDNLYPVVENGKVGLRNRDGVSVLPAIYDVFYNYGYGDGDGLIAAVKNGKVGFVDIKGNTVIDFQFPDAGKSARVIPSYKFLKGLAVILPLNSYRLANVSPGEVRCKVINSEGKLLFEFYGTPRTFFGEKFMLLEVSKASDENSWRIYELIDRSGNRYPLPHHLQLPFFSRENTSEGVLCMQMKEKNDIPAKRKFGYLKIKVN